MGATEVIHQISMSNSEKFRSPAEVIARYNLGCQKYQKLKLMDNSNREQLQMLYAEVKTLGWMMGRDEKKIINEMNGIVTKH